MQLYFYFSRNIFRNDKKLGLPAAEGFSFCDVEARYLHLRNLISQTFDLPHRPNIFGQSPISTTKYSAPYPASEMGAAESADRTTRSQPACEGPHEVTTQSPRNSRESTALAPDQHHHRPIIYGESKEISTQTPSRTLSDIFTERFDRQFTEHFSLHEDYPGELPVVLVLGEPSVGKSTVLRRLTGIPFPTDAYLGTRSPILTTFMPLDHDASSHVFRAAVSTTENDKVYCNSKQELCLAIDEAWFRLRYGDNQHDHGNSSRMYSEGTVSVHVYQSSGPFFHVWDFPGMTERSSHEPEYDTLMGTEKILRGLAAHSTTTLLVVSSFEPPVKALEIASEADPSGERTIGVITRCDTAPTISPGDTEHMLRLQIAFMRMMIPVVGVSSAEGVTEAEVDSKEQELIQKHEALRGLFPNDWGIEALASRVADMMGKGIVEALSRSDAERENFKATLVLLNG